MDCHQRLEITCVIAQSLKAKNIDPTTIKRITVHLFDGSAWAFPPLHSCKCKQCAGACELAQPMGDDPHCGRDILSTIRGVGHRLTTSEVLSEMESRELLWGESTVKGWLSRLVREGQLTNNPQAKPKGYGLPEWN